MFTPSAVRAPELPRVLLVDDEVAILDGLRRQLRKRFTVHTATSGAEGLELLATQSIAVVVSDMRMPGMDGATFLSHARGAHPDVVRILLTGNADTRAAIAAVNDGQIYRFLVKPCPTDALIQEITAAAELNRLAVAEKELLRNTLRRTVEALTATLSLAEPLAFARAARVSRLATELAQALHVEETWEINVTAMLSHMGAVTLPADVLAKLERGTRLDADEQDMVARVPQISRDLVAVIPRLEDIAEAIGWQRARFDGAGAAVGVPAGQDLPLAVRILRVASDFDRGMAQRPSATDTIAQLKSDAGAYDPEVMAALSQLYKVNGPVAVPREVGVEELREGMVIVDDIQAADGVLLVGRGTLVTEPMIQRLQNYVTQRRVLGPFLVQAR